MPRTRTAPSRIYFKKGDKKRNMVLFDAGLHTQGMKPKEGEMDMEFVERFLVKFFEGCRNRGGRKYRYFLMDHRPGNDYITVWGVKR